MAMEEGKEQRHLNTLVIGKQSHENVWLRTEPRADLTSIIQISSESCYDFITVPPS